MDYYFKFVFTKANVGTAPASAPTLTISDLVGNTQIGTGLALTALTGQAGVYFYVYSGAAGLNLVGKAATTDTTMDESERYYEATLSTLASTNGTKLNQTVDLTAGQSIAVSDKTGFSLSAAGILAIWNQLFTDPGIVINSFGAKLRDWALGTDKKSLISTDVQDVSGTLHIDAKTLNGAVPNNYAGGDTPGTTAMLTNYARRTGDYSTLTANQVWAALTASLITPGSIGAWILDKLDVKVSSVSVGTVPTVAQIWQYAWRTLTTGSAKSGVVEESNTISANTFATFSYQISDLGSLANYSTIYFTLKTTKKDSDNDAILQVSKKLSGVGDGLLKILGGTISPTASDGSITVDNVTTGIITVNVAVGVMSLLKSGKYFADVKIVRSSGVPVEILRDYSFNLLDVVTKAIA